MKQLTVKERKKLDELSRRYQGASTEISKETGLSKQTIINARSGKINMGFKALTLIREYLKNN